MGEIIGAAELAVRDMLKRIFKLTNGKPLEAVDFMDDGTPIQLKVTIDEKTGGAVFDFEGTGPEAYGKQFNDLLLSAWLIQTRQLECTYRDL